MQRPNRKMCHSSCQAVVFLAQPSLTSRRVNGCRIPETAEHSSKSSQCLSLCSSSNTFLRVYVWSEETGSNQLQVGYETSAAFFYSVADIGLLQISVLSSLICTNIRKPFFFFFNKAELTKQKKKSCQIVCVLEAQTLFTALSVYVARCSLAHWNAESCCFTLW